MADNASGETGSPEPEAGPSVLPNGPIGIGVPDVLREGLIALAFFVVLAAASYAPIWSGDYFWHLSAGRWIVEHGALPVSDPLTVASTREPWVNGEWLFEVALIGIHQIAGHEGVALLRAVAIAALFTFAYVRLLAVGSRLMALTVAFFSWYGALPWLRERPSAPGALLALVLILVMCIRSGWRRGVLVVLLTILWVNVHPSAVLAPVIVGAVLLASIVEERAFTSARLVELFLLPAIAGAALFVNPWGLDGVLLPFRVSSIAQLDVLSNEEWGPSRLSEFRFFAVALVATAAALLTSARRRGWCSSGLLLTGFAALAMQFARSQTQFFVVLPILLVPHLHVPREALRRLLAVPLALTALTIVAMSPFEGGIDMAKFPVASTVRVQTARLRGNILCSYGLGGFLTWSFGRERRVLNDGRNELHVDYARRWKEARRSASSLERFLDDYDVGLAWVGMNEGPVFVRAGAAGELSPIRQWDAYFPRERWALVAIDRAAAVFARRSKNDPRAIASIELPREILPPIVTTQH